MGGNRISGNLMEQNCPLAGVSICFWTEREIKIYFALSFEKSIM